MNKSITQSMETQGVENTQEKFARLDRVIEYITKKLTASELGYILALVKIDAEKLLKDLEENEESPNLYDEMVINLYNKLK